MNYKTVEMKIAEKNKSFPFSIIVFYVMTAMFLKKI